MIYMKTVYADSQEEMDRIDAVLIKADIDRDTTWDEGDNCEGHEERD